MPTTSKRCACPAPHVEIRKGKFWCLDCGGRVSAGNKFNAERASCGLPAHDGKHDSVREAQRCGELQLMEKAGQICSLEFQPEYEFRHNGLLLCKYRGDWRYIEINKNFTSGVRIFNGPFVEDLKGRRTAVYRLKKKMLMAFYAIPIRETT